MSKTRPFSCGKTSGILAAICILATSEAMAAGELDIYEIPAISNEFVLPDSPPSHLETLGSATQTLSVQAAPGEYEPLTFVARANQDLQGVRVVASGLTGAAGSIAQINVDLRVVKVWWVAGTEAISRLYEWNLNSPALAPELLLKNDALIKVEDGKNYILQTNGEYLCISDEGVATPTTISVEDSDTLQPVDIPQGSNKQFWVTIKVPDGTPPGLYEGTIQITDAASNTLADIALELTVLDIDLPESFLEYSIYYTGKCQQTGSIGGGKSEQQYRAEMNNLIAHGVKNPIIYQSFNETWLGKVLDIRQEVGMGAQPLYYLGLTWGYPSITDVEDLLLFVEDYNITEVYFYGVDEANGDALLAQRSSWEAIQAAGGKVFVACRPETTWDAVGDVLDLPIISSGAYDKNFHPVYGVDGTDTRGLYAFADLDYYVEETAKWHSAGKKVLSYSNPQVGIEQPETSRRNFGLWLWQTNFDGSADFAYQYYDSWNDFKHASYKSHNFTHPTNNGVVDTTEWEGFREGVDDTRYLAALMQAIEDAQTAGVDSSAAEAWMTNIKSTDIYGQDLYLIRSEIIQFIVQLNAASTQDLQILSTEAIDITSDSARIHFVFNQTAQGQVEYGADTNYGLWNIKEESFNHADHSQPLVNLNPGTLYHYRVHGWDPQHREVISPDYSFTTPASSDAGTASDAGLADAGSAGDADLANAGCGGCSGQSSNTGSQGFWLLLLLGWIVLRNRIHIDNSKTFFGDFPIETQI